MKRKRTNERQSKKKPSKRRKKKQVSDENSEEEETVIPWDGYSPKQHEVFLDVQKTDQGSQNVNSFQKKFKGERISQSRKNKLNVHYHERNRPDLANIVVFEEGKTRKERRTRRGRRTRKERRTRKKKEKTLEPGQGNVMNFDSNESWLFEETEQLAQKTKSQMKSIIFNLATPNAKVPMNPFNHTTPNLLMPMNQFNKQVSTKYYRACGHCGGEETEHLSLITCCKCEKHFHHHCMQLHDVRVKKEKIDFNRWVCHLCRIKKPKNEPLTLKNTNFRQYIQHICQFGKDFQNPMENLPLKQETVYEIRRLGGIMRNDPTKKPKNALDWFENVEWGEVGKSSWGNFFRIWFDRENSKENYPILFFSSGARLREQLSNKKDVEHELKKKGRKDARLIGYIEPNVDICLESSERDVATIVAWVDDRDEQAVVVSFRFKGDVFVCEISGLLRHCGI